MQAVTFFHAELCLGVSSVLDCIQSGCGGEIDGIASRRCSDCECVWQFAGGYTCPEVVKTAIPVEIKGADRVPDLQKTREELCGMVYMLTLSDPTRRLLHSRPHPNLPSVPEFH